MWLVAGFAALGFLVGNLVGFSATSVVTALLGLMFAFAGGSVLAFLEKFGPDDRRAASQALLALSLACTVGLYTGIFVNEHRLLSPKRPPSSAAASDSTASSAEESQVAVEKYVRKVVVDETEAIEALRRRGDINGEAAYTLLRDGLRRRLGESTP